MKWDDIVELIPGYFLTLKEATLRYSVVGTKLVLGRIKDKGWDPVSAILLPKIKQNTGSRSVQLRRFFNEKYTGMIRRCYKTTCKSYKDYGGRGITVCEEWQGPEGRKKFWFWCQNTNNFQQAFNNKLELDRIEPNGNYEPGNCRFISKKEQALNRTSNVLIEVRPGFSLPLTQAVSKYSTCNYTTVRARLLSNWHPLQALFLPVGSSKNIRGEFVQL